MTTLNEQEKEAKFNAWIMYLDEYGKSVTLGEKWGFEAGFQAGLAHNRARVEELEAALQMVKDRLDESEGGRVYFLGAEIDQIEAAITRTSGEG